MADGFCNECGLALNTSFGCECARNKAWPDGPAGLPAAQELLPCPFCNRQPERFSRASSVTRTGMFHAASCFGGGYSAHARAWGDTEEAMIDLWNARAPQAAAAGGVAPTPSLVEENRRLREALTEAREWIENWSPDFVQDDDWPDTAARIDTALRSGEQA